MNSMKKIHPSVDGVIKPIVYEMTKIDLAQRSNPILTKTNEPDYVKDVKKSCVHVIFEDGEYRLAVGKDNDGHLVCRACGRRIATDFDKTAIEKIMNCIEVINQIVLFGMLNGLKAEPLQTLIDIKRQLPAAAQLIKELNVYITEENKSNDSANNLGIEYAIPSSLTQMI